MTDPRVTFIGAGNMAKSLIGGLLRAGHGPDRLGACDPDAGQLSQIADLHADIATASDNVAAIAQSDVVVLAVKPQIMRVVCEPLRAAFAARHATSGCLVISIAAGIDLAALERWCGAVPIVRCMPNTPALHGAGITALFGNSATSAAQLAQARAILDAAGTTVVVESEALLDPVTGVSGSGPAYFFAFMEAMSAAGVAEGLTEQDARQLAVETAFGAALMAQSTDEPLSVLRERVTSPGGTTAEALASFGRDDLAGVVARAVNAATVRSRELAIEFGKD